MVELELGEFLNNLDIDVEERVNLISKENKIQKELNELYKKWKNQVTNSIK